MAMARTVGAVEIQQMLIPDILEGICLQQHDVQASIADGDPVPVDSSGLQQAAAHQLQAHMQSLSLDPRSAFSDGPRLCTYHRRFSRPATYWDVPISNSKLHGILRFCMGAHQQAVCALLLAIVVEAQT